MELERRYIERQDFTQARRGYDPVEVDRHLRAVAEAVEDLKSRASRSESQTSLAGAAASRVESIVAAAEASAREIEQRARAEAQELRDNAEREAAQRVTGAGEMVAELTERASELRREIEDFVNRVQGLKGSVDSIRADFDASAPIPPQGAPALELEGGPVAEPALELDRFELPDNSDEVTRPVTLTGDLDPEPEPSPEPEPEPEPVAATPAGGGDGGRASEGARLIALNMALSGTPREETARYLRENFDIDEQDELLDEVYARAGS